MIEIDLTMHTPEEQAGLIRAFQDRCRKAIDASLAGIPPIEADIVRVLMNLDELQYIDSYDTRMAAYGKAVDNLLAIIKRAFPGIDISVNAHMKVAQTALSAIEAQIEKEHGNVSVQ